MAGLAGDEATAVQAPHAAVGLEQGERPVDGREARRAAASRAALQSSSAVNACCRVETSSVRSVRWRVLFSHGRPY